jgi:hypothetical protein
MAGHQFACLPPVLACCCRCCCGGGWVLALGPPLPLPLLELHCCQGVAQGLMPCCCLVLLLLVLPLVAALLPDAGTTM